jgi:hypothetical protein
MENPDANWVRILPALQWNLNGAYNIGTRTSAHEFIYGISLQGPLEGLQPGDDDVSDLPFLREAVRKEAHLAMDFAAAKAKRWYDAKHRPIQLRAGDKVYLRLHDGYHLPGKPARKWSQQRTGPFEIKRMVGDLAAELELPPAWKIHPVISCQQLQPAHADAFQPEEPSPVEEDDGQYVVERIMRREVRRLGRKATPFEGFWVRWKGWGPEHDAWVRTADIDPEVIADFKTAHPEAFEVDEGPRRNSQRKMK